MANKKNPKFVGKFAVLDQPIKIPEPPRQPSILEGLEVEEKYQQAVQKHLAHCAIIGTQAAIERLNLLLEYYEIPEQDQNCWFSLSFALAREYLRGFSFDRRKPAGAKTKWNVRTQAALYLAVIKRIKKLKSEGKLYNIGRVCLELANEPPWKDICGNKKSGNDRTKKLQNQYAEAKKNCLIKEAEQLEGLYGIDRATRFLEILTKQY